MNIKLPEFTIDSLELNEESKNKMLEVINSELTYFITESGYADEIAESVFKTEKFQSLVKTEYEKIIKNNIKELVQDVARSKVKEITETHISWDLNKMVTDAVNQEVTNIINEELPENLSHIRVNICKLIKNYTEN